MYKRTIIADPSKIEMRNLAPDRLELEVTNNSPGNYDLEVRLYFEGGLPSILPAKLGGKKPSMIPRVVTTTICSESVDPRYEQRVRSLQKKMREIQDKLSKVIRAGHYHIYTHPDGYLEFKLDIPKK